MSTNVWMKVTDDIYELPVAVADTAAGLAKLVGVNENSIYVAIRRERTHGWKSPYIKVVIDDKEG